MSFKKIFVTLSVSSLSILANAQQANTTKPTVQPTNVGNVSDALIKKSNSFEKEVTPLLREISKKRSQLELRKLDRDLEKIDEEALKSQVQLEALMNSANDKVSGANNSLNSPTPSPFPAPIQQTNPSVQPQFGLANPSEVKVLMIFGFDTNLYAKLASGQQGGYVVKKGDITPDGKTVIKITSNYIEIKDSEKPDSKPQRIFVSSVNVPDAPTTPTANPSQPLLAPPAPANTSLPSFPSLPSRL